MRMLSSWVSAVVLATCTTAAEAQTYVIKLKTYPEAGMTVTIRDTQKETGSTKFFDSAGKMTDEIKPKDREMVYTLTILEREKSEGPASKYACFYDKATETQAGKTRIFSYEGRSVVFERKDGKYRVGVVGKPPLDRKDLDYLIQKANESTSTTADQDKAITPAKAVAVGDTWTIDPKALSALFKEGDFDFKASQAEAKLVKVYTKGPSQFGVIDVNLKLAVKGIGPAIKFEPPATLVVKVSIDAAIDGSSTARTETHTGKFQGKSLVQQGEKKLTMEMDVGGSGRIERSEEKHDAKALKVPVVDLTGPGDWALFTSKEGRFSANFPGNPDKTQKDNQDNVTTTFTVNQEKGAIAYMVVYTDYAKDISKADPKTVLQAVVDQFAKDTKAKKDIKLNGYPGIELSLMMDQAGTKLAMTLRVYIVEGRLYQVLVVSELGLKDKAQAEKFLDSFRLHEK
jgi:hypothetical protein